jgi:hypothetical protein
METTKMLQQLKSILGPAAPSQEQSLTWLDTPAMIHLRGGSAYGDERALGSRTYFQRKISFLQHLGNNDFTRAEEYLDEADSYSCVGGSEFDRGAFEAYKSEAR